MNIRIQSYIVKEFNNDYLVMTANEVVIAIQHRSHDNNLFSDLFVGGDATIRIGETISDKVKTELGSDLIPIKYIEGNSYEYSVAISEEE